MTNPREALVERVARLLALETEGSEEWWTLYMRRAAAAIDIVLEEAARAAEAFPARTHGNLATAPYAAAEQAADEIAAAIRAMIPSGKDH